MSLFGLKVDEMGLSKTGVGEQGTSTTHHSSPLMVSIVVIVNFSVFISSFPVSCFLYATSCTISLASGEM